MPCEICGRENVKVYLTNIDGAKLWVCSDCNPSGEGRIKFERKKKIIKTKPDIKKDIKKEFKQRKKHKKHNYHRKSFFEMEDYDLIENYGNVLKKAREDKKLTLEEFAKKIKESASYLQKIEHNRLKPNDRVLLKIYDFLGINLLKLDNEENIEEQRNTDVKENNTKNTEIFTEMLKNNKRKIMY